MTRGSRRAPTTSKNAGPLGRLTVFAVLTAASLAVAVPTFDRLSHLGDIILHAASAPTIARSQGAISYSLWYPLLYWTSGASTDVERLRVVSVVLLTVCVVAKVCIASAYALDRTRSALASVVVGLVALLAMPLPNPAQPENIYLGQITPTLWHNSTWIFSMPFALLAFLAAARLVRSPSWSRAGVASAALLISTACKPNFTLAVGPVLAATFLVQGVRSRELARFWTARAMVTLAPTAILLGVQYALTFGPERVVDYTLVIEPFSVWRVYSASIPWSIAVSVAAPAVLYLALPRAIRSRTEILLSLATLAVAVTQLGLLAERDSAGETVVYGNFFWGAYSSMAILMVVLLVHVMNLEPTHTRSRWQKPFCWIASVVIVGQCATGLFYATHAARDIPIYRAEASRVLSEAGSPSSSTT